MPYYGAYPMGIYQPMQNPYQPMQMNQPMQMSQQPATQPIQPVVQPTQQISNGIIWCQGEEGAKGYLVAPGNSVLLMDSENSTFYIKSTDASGIPQPLRIFDYTERTGQRAAAQAANFQPEEYVTRQEFNALAARLEAMATVKTSQKKSVQKEETENG